MENFEKLVNDINGVVWGPALLFLLMGTHVFLTFRLKFIQRYLFDAIKISFNRDKEGEGDVSQFAALMTALAATIGTGNIVGVATAISSGGPGAVLWMWLTGVFGMATKYSEAVLAVKYRVVTPSGQMAGGPMYAIQNGLKQKWLAVIFAFFTSIAAFGIGNMVQANSIATLMKESFHVEQWITGLVIAFLTAIVILGGIKSISKACEALVPFMAIFYVLGCLVLLIKHWATLPDTVHLIVQSAFTGQAAVGGGIETPKESFDVLQAGRIQVLRGANGAPVIGMRQGE